MTTTATLRTTLLLLLGLAAGALLPGCHPPATGVTAFTDPEFSGHHFKRILVLADTTDLQRRAAIEQAMIRELRGRAAWAVESFSYFPPTRSFQMSALLDTMRLYNIDGYLVIGPEGTGVYVEHVPQTTTTTVKKEGEEKEVQHGEETKKVWVPTEEKVTTTVEGGYTSATNWTRYRASLVDLASGKTAWVGVGVLYGDGASGAGSFGERLARQLVRDGLCGDPMLGE
jgi:hypothetical protein